MSHNIDLLFEHAKHESIKTGDISRLLIDFSDTALIDIEDAASADSAAKISRIKRIGDAYPALRTEIMAARLKMISRYSTRWWRNRASHFWLRATGEANRA